MDAQFDISVILGNRPTSIIRDAKRIIPFLINLLNQYFLENN